MSHASGEPSHASGELPSASGEAPQPSGASKCHSWCRLSHAARTKASGLGYAEATWPGGVPEARLNAPEANETVFNDLPSELQAYVRDLGGTPSEWDENPVDGWMGGGSVGASGGDESEEGDQSEAGRQEDQAPAVPADAPFASTNASGGPAGLSFVPFEVHADDLFGEPFALMRRAFKTSDRYALEMMRLGWDDVADLIRTRDARMVGEKVGMLTGHLDRFVELIEEAKIVSAEQQNNAAPPDRHAGTPLPRCTLTRTTDARIVLNG